MGFDVRDLLILSAIPGIGPHRLRALVDHFRDPHNVTTASARQLATVDGIDQRMALAISRFFRNSGPMQVARDIDRQIRQLDKVSGRLVTLWDSDYPANLKKIYDPPPFLFVRGSFVDTDNPSIAIVGTRNPTTYGTQMAEKFATELARLGITIVSGLARGIDTSAHAAALKVGTRTIAIIGSGVDVIYPPENAALATRIIASGCLASEYLMGTKPDAGNFPKRNRIISGVTLGTIIIETGVDGGAMITAATALDQNREIFAIPSQVTDRRTSGTNLLIKEGKAKLVEQVDDVLEELSSRLRSIIGSKSLQYTRPPLELSMFEQQLYDAMAEDPVHIDALASRANMPMADALVHLLSLEFKGAIRQIPGKYFVKS